MSTNGEEMSAEMCEGEDCWDTTDNILCVDDYCHVIEAEFIGFRGVPCAGGVCGYEDGVSICNQDKCTFTSEDGLSFGQGEIDINGVIAPCDEDPILCAGLLCACVDPNQHFETDLLGMDYSGIMNCDNGTCQMTSQVENSILTEDEYAVEYGDIDPYGEWDHVIDGANEATNPHRYEIAQSNEFFKPNLAHESYLVSYAVSFAVLFLFQ